jgi:uncharacterized membrane protein HdeD (DUF308 family)
MNNRRLVIAGFDQNKPAQSHWLLHLMEGLILIVLGLLAVFMSPWLGAALFGWLFLTGGAAGSVTR